MKTLNKTLNCGSLLTKISRYSPNRLLAQVSLLLAGLSIGVGTASAIPGTIIQPASASIQLGGPGFGSINDTRDQAGLSVGYTSGVTVFDSYVSLHSLVFSGNEWFSEVGAGSHTIVTYDLGSVMSIDRLALWNEDYSGIGKLDLLASTDGVTFTEFATDLMPVDNPNDVDYLAEVFTFASVVSARYVRFNITDSPQIPAGFDAAAIGEVAFREATAASVPEAGSTLLLLAGALGTLAWFQRRTIQARARVS